jgi:hypothetical protein
MTKKEDGQVIESLDVPDSLKEPDEVDRAVMGWFYEHIHGSAVGRDTEGFNHLYASLGPLKDRIRSICKG